ncbi:DUF262 domain-containing protein [Nocardia sp. CA-145437]|uniref:DUF262 domain-containing protein n=1 Tax=Nocardia sp. CA-145437 TaxID=3239980 RepID=UPI003D999DDF
MSLESEIIEYRRQIATDAYPMSIGELVNLYRDGEIDVHPEFQRIFRWTDTQKSRLIESILLGIPLPSIFVAQNEKGVWDVVDGVQRLSTIFQFMGVLRDDEGRMIKPFVCSAGPFLKSLEGTSFEPIEEAPYCLDASQRLDFKRARIDVKIIKRESDNRAKYDLFQRLNSYGSIASPQELRNCLLVSMSQNHYKWLVDLAESDDFRYVLNLPDRLLDERYHMELALRFISLRRVPEDRLSTIGNIGDFLTEEIVPLVDLDSVNLQREKEVFEKTFRILREGAGGEAMRKWNLAKGRAEGPFSLTAFEALALGIGFALDNREVESSEIEDKQQELWSEEQFASGYATGLRADTRMRKTIPYGRQLFLG